MAGVIALSSLLMIACKQDSKPTFSDNDFSNKVEIKSSPKSIPEPTTSFNQTETKLQIVKETDGDSISQNIKSSEQRKPTKKSSSKIKKKTLKPKSKPQIEFDVIRHDFGTIVQGDTVLFNFNFVNKGKAPLEIESAKATCGCTQPSFPFIPIEPGEEGYIGVMYISVGKEGHQEPTITVHSNVSKEPITLLMTGIVEVPEKEENELSTDPSDDASLLDTIGKN